MHSKKISISIHHPLAGRVDNVVIDNDITNFTLTNLHAATEYEIKLNAVRGSQESKIITTTVFTGTSFLSSLLEDILIALSWKAPSIHAD